MSVVETNGGVMALVDFKTCPDCDGKGRRVVRIDEGFDWSGRWYERKLEKPCKSCKGKGFKVVVKDTQ